MAQDLFEQLHEAVKQAESRGQRYDSKGNLLTSPKGAQGEMQVMPKTARDPGFGVAPAKGKDPDDLARVGKDYLKAMVDKYGDTQKAVIAYNWGPGNTDKWLASGADPKALPAETQGYVARISKALGGDKLAPITSSGPTESEKTMTNALQSGMSAQNLVKDAGPGYKAAMAMMFLADDKPKTDEDDIWKEADAAVEEEDTTPNAFAGLDLGYQSPFPAQKPQVAQFAEGGEASSAAADLAALMPSMEDASPAPFMAFKSANKQTIGDKDLENMMLGLGTNSATLGVNLSNMRQGEKDNLAQSLLAAYRQQMGDVSLNVNAIRPVNAPPGIYAGSLSAGIPVGNRDQLMVGINGLRTPDDARITGYNVGYSGEVGPGRLNAMMMQPKDNPKDRSYQLQYQIPFKADGGIVYRAEGSPETGELSPEEIEAASRPAFVTSKSGIGRTAGPASNALNSGAAYGAMARGIADTPYNVVGSFADIGTLALRPFGYKEEKPIMGSDWIKEKMTKLGIRPGEETDPALKGFRTAAELGSSLVNPAAPVRAAAQVVEKVGGKAADMLRRMSAPKAEVRAAEVAAAERTLQDTQPIRVNTDEALAAARDREAAAPPGWGMVDTRPGEMDIPATGRIVAAQDVAPEVVQASSLVPEVAAVAPPVQMSTVSAEFPMVGRLDAYASELKSPIQKQQFLNEVKNKFRDYDLDRAEEALADFGPKDKLMPEQIKTALEKLYSPSRFRSEDIPAGTSGSLYGNMDNVYYPSKVGTSNLYLNVPPEVAKRGEEVNKIQSRLQSLYDSRLPLDKFDELKGVLAKDDMLKDSPAAQDLTKSLEYIEKSYKSIRGTQDTMNQLRNGFLWPSLYTEKGRPRYFYEMADEEEARLLQEMGGARRYQISAEKRAKLDRDSHIYATKKVMERANEHLVAMGGNPVDITKVNFNPNVAPMDAPRNTLGFESKIDFATEPMLLQINEASSRIKNHLRPRIEALESTLAPYRTYASQHPTVTSGAHPVGFSRFVEQEVNIPGYGAMQGRHVLDLQSDLAQDVRKRGPKGGSAAKDQAEYDNLNEQVSKMRLMEPAKNEAAQKSREIEMAKIEKRISEVGSRLRSKTTDYSLEQPFAGFEKRAAVEQQLLIKNAIQAAMRAGKNFVTFPGNESAQRKLYEKVKPNLTQVIKDLGGEKAGFELKSIQLPPSTAEVKLSDGTITHPLGEPVNAWGIIWSPEAATRIQQSGVPFAQGGAVERVQGDNRRYL